MGRFRVTTPDSHFALICSLARCWLLLTLAGDLEETEHEFPHSGEVEFINE